MRKLTEPTPKSHTSTTTRLPQSSSHATILARWLPNILHHWWWTAAARTFTSLATMWLHASWHRKTRRWLLPTQCSLPTTFVHQPISTLWSLCFLSRMLTATTLTRMNYIIMCTTTTLLTCSLQRCSRVWPHRWPTFLTHSPTQNTTSILQEVSTPSTSTTRITPNSVCRASIVAVAKSVAAMWCG